MNWNPLNPALSHRMGYRFSVLVPYQRNAGFTPLQRWTSAERLRIPEPRASAEVEAASRPRSFGKALNTYGLGTTTRVLKGFTPR